MVPLLGWIGDGSGILMTGFLVVETLFAVLATGWFLVSQRGSSGRDLEPAEKRWYSREAEVLLTELAPLVITLNERERAAELELGDMDAPRAREVLEEIGWSASRDLWSAFARASAHAEEDPKRAVEELRCLRPQLQERVTSLDMLSDESLTSGMPAERNESDGIA